MGFPRGVPPILTPPNKDKEDGILTIFQCSICGYDYDPKVGDPDRGIPPGTRFEDLPADWVCPICGAEKALFHALQNANQPAEAAAETAAPVSDGAMSDAWKAAILANLARGYEKQFQAEKAAQYKKLADYYAARIQPVGDAAGIRAALKEDLAQGYAKAFEAARAEKDRGAQRALTWGEKVTRIQDSILSRLEGKGTGDFENSRVFVCDACGFIYIGDAAPDICPVCKVPAFKFDEIKRGA